MGGQMAPLDLHSQNSVGFLWQPHKQPVPKQPQKISTFSLDFQFSTDENAPTNPEFIHEKISAKKLTLDI
jgi:hypothetical protein